MVVVGLGAAKPVRAAALALGLLAGAIGCQQVSEAPVAKSPLRMKLDAAPHR